MIDLLIDLMRFSASLFVTCVKDPGQGKTVSGREVVSAVWCVCVCPRGAGAWIRARRVYGSEYVESRAFPSCDECVCFTGGGEVGRNPVFPALWSTRCFPYSQREHNIDQWHYHYMCTANTTQNIRIKINHWRKHRPCLIDHTKSARSPKQGNHETTNQPTTTHTFWE